MAPFLAIPSTSVITAIEALSPNALYDISELRLSLLLLLPLLLLQ